MKSNSVYLLFFLTTFLLGSCRESDVKEDVVSAAYEDLKVDNQVVDGDDVLQVKFLNLSYPVELIQFKESERTFIKSSESFQCIEFDWRNSGIDDISFYKAGDEYVMLFPTYTEEFITPCLISIQENGAPKDLGAHTFSYSDFDRANESASQQKFVLKNVNDTIRVFQSGSKSDVMLSQLTFGYLKDDLISDKEKMILESFNNPEHNPLKTWIGSYDLELDVVNGMEENKIRILISVKNHKNLSIKEQVNQEEEKVQKLVLQDESEDRLVFTSLEEPDVEYVLSRLDNAYYLSGKSIYAINPPNEKYELNRIPE